jgi:hypothetical protein
LGTPDDVVYALERDLDRGSAFAVFVGYQKEGILVANLCRAWDLTQEYSSARCSDSKELGFESVTPGFTELLSDMEIRELNAEELRFIAARRVV